MRPLSLKQKYAVIDQLEELTFLYWTDRSKFEGKLKQFAKKILEVE